MTRQLRATVFFLLLFPLKEAAQFAVEEVFATFDHSDIRGSKPHNRDPAGAASDYRRGFSPKTHRIEPSRILLSVHRSAATRAATFEITV